jgi:hypothetical protein
MSRLSASVKFMLLVSAVAGLLVVSGCSDNCTHNSENYVETGTGESCDICVDPPDDCSGLIPETAVLSIHLSQPLPKLVRVYSGKAYETGTLVHQRVPTAKDFSLELPLGDYSATALYVTGTDSVLSVDGDELDYRKLGTCEKDCYVPEPGSVDLKRN